MCKNNYISVSKFLEMAKRCPGRRPLFVQVLPVIIMGRLPFTFFVSQVVLLILHLFLVDIIMHTVFLGSPAQVRHIRSRNLQVINCNALRLKRQLSTSLQKCMPITCSVELL